MSKLSFGSYLRLIQDTLAYAIESGRTNEEAKDFHFDDRKKYEILKTIKSLLDLSNFRVKDINNEKE